MLFRLCCAQLFMETKIQLRNAVIDADINDFKEEIEIKVFSDTNDLLVYNHNKEEMEGSIFGLWINCGENKEKAIMFDVGIDDLELFANSTLKQIEIVRKNYKEQIKYQTDNGYSV